MHLRTMNCKVGQLPVTLSNRFGHDKAGVCVQSQIGCRRGIEQAALASAEEVLQLNMAPLAWVLSLVACDSIAQLCVERCLNRVDITLCERWLVWDLHWSTYHLCHSHHEARNASV